MGDAAVFSLGRDKAVSSVFGGVGVVRDTELGKKLKGVWTELPKPDKRWVVQQLMHPVLTRAALETYGWGMGKLILAGAQRLGLLSLAVHKQERRGERPASFPSRYPDELAAIGLSQLEAIESFNAQRRAAAQVYADALGVNLADEVVHLRYPVLVDNPWEILARAKKRGWIWGDWYRFPVTPEVSQEVSGYEAGSCPVAEEVCKRVVNLPTHPRMKLGEAEEIAKI